MEYGALVVLDDLQLLLMHSTACDNRASIKRRQDWRLACCNPFHDGQFVVASLDAAC